MINYIVIEGFHKNPNEMSTLDENTKKEHGPFINKDEAESLAKSLIQKKIVEDNKIEYIEDRCTKMEYQKHFLKVRQAFPVLQS